jgi:hypothetical protein
VRMGRGLGKKGGSGWSERMRSRKVRGRIEGI